MNVMYIDYIVSEKCKNPLVFEICHQCNACGRFDRKTMYEDRLRVLEEYLETKKNFNLWSQDERIRKIQEKNVSKDIKRIESEIQKLKKIIEKRGGK